MSIDLSPTVPSFSPIPDRTKVLLEQVAVDRSISNHVLTDPKRIPGAIASAESFMMPEFSGRRSPQALSPLKTTISTGEPLAATDASVATDALSEPLPATLRRADARPERSQPSPPMSVRSTALSAAPALAPASPASPSSIAPSPLPSSTSTQAPTHLASPAPEESPDLFERVFGRSRTSSPQQIIIPLYINDQLQGTIPVLTTTQATPLLQVQATVLLEKLGVAIRPELLQRLTDAIDASGNLSLEALQQIGLSAVFDNRRLELRIQVPPALRKPNVYSAGALPPDAAQALHPSAVSGYLNMRLGQDFVWGQPDHPGRQPMQVGLDGALNIEGWVLESSLSISEDKTPALSRGDIRVVRDSPERAMRYTIGDLVVPVTGYQSSLPMLGIAMARNFSLQPYRTTRPISRFEFLLERPSTVEVLINNRPTQTLRLPAGTQDIRNLPLNGGVNDVELIITDNLGQVQRLSFPASVASDLLAPGLQQFAYSVGVPSHTENGTRTYDWTDPTLSLSHRWGFTNQLTVGGYLQANVHQQVIGLEGIWATGLGNWDWNVAVSRDRESRFDGAATLQYEFTHSLGSNGAQQSLRLAAEYRGPNFTPVGTELAKNDYSFDLSASYSRPLLQGMTANLTGRYQIGRGSMANAYSVSLGLSQSLGNGISVNLNLSQQQRSDGQNERQASLGVFWLLPRQRQSLVSTTNLSSQTDPSSQLIWSINSGRSVDGVNGSITASTSPDQYRLSGQLSYTGYRLETSLSQELSFLNADMRDVTNTTRLTVGTAIAFADGHWAWSRPIGDSFAMVIRQANLRGQIVQINPSSNGASARADGAGHAIVPGLQPYSVSTVTLNAPNLPVGYDVGPHRYSLLPTYRSGTAITVGTEGTIFLRGILLDQTQAPIALQAGSIVSLSDPHEVSMPLFTNQAGRFAVMGLKPGRYEIHLNNQTGVARFEIPDGQSGVYDLGTLAVMMGCLNSCP